MLPTPVFWPGEFHGLYRGCNILKLDTYKIYLLVMHSYILGRAMAPHSNTAWKIPWMEEPGRLQSMGS